MKRSLLGMVILCLVSGCQNLTGATPDVRPMQLSENAIIDQGQADEAKEIVLSMEEVVEIKGVSDNENTIYLAPRVKHFDRFRLKEIRKYGYDSVKKRYPDATVFLSTDQKIFMELEKLETELKNKTISEQRLQEQLNKLKDMMKG
ncbi:hypothetical protein N0O92_07540 [Alkalihalobacillus sp. MEB130]|uniref:hypothetical protein n=1 Tax=Alkalihalobacillus sp. MEB130 TaxID=2976704 RepID=UPI0028DE1387|nr:hypothetical protein [Alkalihalobacillus sp. MEB130]MDT8860084.1 hypothetical protein [Alkalihalobacillus sp. MEB130]